MKHTLKTAQIADFLKKQCFKRNTNYKNYWFYVKICVSRGTLTTKITNFLKKAYPKRNTNCKNCWFFEKNNVSCGTKSINIEYFRKKQRFTWNTRQKNAPWLTTLLVIAKKLTIYGGYFCCFFLFHVKPTGVFGVILRFFGNFKPPKHMFACFLVVSCETPGIFFGIM